MSSVYLHALAQTIELVRHHEVRAAVSWLSEMLMPQREAHVLPRYWHELQAAASAIHHHHLGLALHTLERVLDQARSTR